MEAAATWFTIVNPCAGGASRRRRQRLFATLGRAGQILEIRETRGPGDAEVLAAAAWRDGHRQFLVVGGDGTAHEAVNGLSVRDGVLPRIAVAPLGTGNDWARSLGLSADPAVLATQMQAGRFEPHDVGTLAFDAAITLPDGRAVRSRRFMNMAGCGYDAYVVQHTWRRGPPRLAYLGGVLAGLTRYQPPVFTLGRGGNDRQARLFVAFFAIGRYCGGGMRFAPSADLADGLLDVVTVEHLGLAAAVRRLPRLYDGTILEDPAVTLTRATSLRVTTDAPCGVEADGQWLGITPVDVGIERHALLALRGA